MMKLYVIVPAVVALEDGRRLAMEDRVAGWTDNAGWSCSQYLYWCQNGKALKPKSEFEDYKVCQGRGQDKVCHDATTTCARCGYKRSESETVPETVTEGQPVQKYYEVYYHRSNSTKCEPETAKHQIAFCSVCSRNQRQYMYQSPARTGRKSVTYANFYPKSDLCTAEALRNQLSPCQKRRLGANAHVWTKTECSTKYKVWHANGNGEGHTTCEHVSALHGLHFHESDGWTTDPTGKPYYTQSNNYDLEPADWLEKYGYRTGNSETPKGSFWTKTPC